MSKQKHRCSTRAVPPTDPECLAALDKWVSGMIRCPECHELAEVLQALLRSGRIRVYARHHLGPQFVIDAQNSRDVRQLMATVRNIVHAALLRLGVKGKVCFQMCNDHGHKDLMYYPTALLKQEMQAKEGHCCGSDNAVPADGISGKEGADTH